MFSFIKNTFIDVFLLYKNFLNWNINKLIIYIWSFIFAFLVSLPFLLLLFIISYFFGVDIKILFLNLLNNEAISNIFINWSIIFITFIFFIFNFYKYILLNKLNFDYLKGIKPKIVDNYYFNIKLIKKYFIISIINLFLLLILFLVFLIIFIILFFAFGSYEGIQQMLANGDNNIFTITTLLFLIIAIICFIYLIFRFIFSYYIFIDENYKEKNAFECIKKSFILTKGYKNFLKYLLLIIIFSIFFIPSYIAIMFFNNNMLNINNYYTYKYGVNDEQKNQLTEIEFKSLELQLSSYSIEDMSNLLLKYSRYILIINIFNYIIFFGMYSMILTSFYKRELLKNN